MMRKPIQLALAVAVVAASLSPAAALEAASPSPAAVPGAEDFGKALAAVRGVALDKAETEAHRVGAVRAAVRLLVWKKRHDDAIAFCREVVAGRDEKAVIDAALRAACLAKRDRHAHLGAEREFLAGFAKGPHASPASAVLRDLDRAAASLSAMAGRRPVPSPVPVRSPSWAASAPGKGPEALRVSLPKLEPPSWLSRLSLPLLPDRKTK